jgi:hypothetical protein
MPSPLRSTSFHDPIPTADVDHAIDHLDAERLEEPRGDPPPSELAIGCRDARHAPHIAIPGADHCGIRSREVDPRKPHLRVPRVGLGRREHVDRKRAGTAAGGDARGDRRGPERRRRAAHERPWRGRWQHRGRMLGQLFGGGGGDRDGQIERLLAHGNQKVKIAIPRLDSGAAPAGSCRADDRGRSRRRGQPHDKRPRP